MAKDPVVVDPPQGIGTPVTPTTPPLTLGTIRTLIKNRRRIIGTPHLSQGIGTPVTPTTPPLILGLVRTLIVNRRILGTPHLSPARGTPVKDRMNGIHQQAMWNRKRTNSILIVANGASLIKQSPMSLAQSRPSRSSSPGTLFFRIDTPTDTFSITGQPRTRISMIFISTHAVFFDLSGRLYIYGRPLSVDPGWCLQRQPLPSLPLGT